MRSFERTVRRTRNASDTREGEGGVRRQQQDTNGTRGRLQ